jgi:hypothetical protein
MEKETKIEISSRKAAFAEMHQFCIMSNIDSNDFIEVTEWTNGEGWDINLSASHTEQNFHLTYGQLKAIKKLIKKLDKDSI